MASQDQCHCKWGKYHYIAEVCVKLLSTLLSTSNKATVGKFTQDLGHSMREALSES